MNPKNVLFFVLFQGMVNIIVYAAEEDTKLSRSIKKIIYYNAAR